MANINTLDIIMSRKMNPLEFNYENLWIPPMNNFLTNQDVESLRNIATSVRFSSNINKKYKMINDIMVPRGFKKFGAGTNRVVYSYYEDPSFVVKIAIDKVGMQDNPAEFKNQFFLKPYVAKTFYISPCGTVGFAERVLPIKNKIEFKEIASDVFDILTNKILGKYVMDDIGTKFFANYGIRKGFGPCILDYTMLYKLDGNKLYCSNHDPDTNEICDGEIDYDAGFNYLVCTKCGRRYYASDLSNDDLDNNGNKKVILKGGNKMKISIINKDTGKIIISNESATDKVMSRENFYKKKSQNKNISVSIIDKTTGNEIISSNNKTKDADISKNDKPRTKREYNRKNPSISKNKEKVEDSIENKKVELNEEKISKVYSDDSNTDCIESVDGINEQNDYGSMTLSAEESSDINEEVKNNSVEIASEVVSNSHVDDYDDDYYSTRSNRGGDRIVTKKSGSKNTRSKSRKIKYNSDYDDRDYE